MLEHEVLRCMAKEIMTLICEEKLYLVTMNPIAEMNERNIINHADNDQKNFNFFNRSLRGGHFGRRTIDGEINGTITR